MHKLIVRSTLILSCCFILNACSDDSKDKAKQTAMQFIEQIKQKMPFKKKAEDTKKTIPAVTYSAKKQKSPFKDDSVGKRPNRNTILRNVDINQLKLVGIIMRNDKEWAIVATGSGQMHALTTGYYVGKQSALVEKITHNSVELTTKSSDNNPYSSIYTLTLQEK